MSTVYGIRRVKCVKCGVNCVVLCVLLCVELVQKRRRVYKAILFYPALVSPSPTASMSLVDMC